MLLGNVLTVQNIFKSLRQGIFTPETKISVGNIFGGPPNFGKKKFDQCFPAKNVGF